jgi:perosamine synthetase
VHVLGHPADLTAIRAEAARFELRVVEDAAESLGASYQGRRVGAGADIACFSFNGNKTITCGGGGMLVTDSAQVAERARYLTTQAKDDPVEYIHHEVGFNYRLTNVLAALGVAQLEQLDKYVQGRRRIASHYQQRLEPLGLRWHTDAPDARSTCWLSTAIVDPERVGVTAVQLRDLLAQKKIQTRRLWQPMHLSPAHCGCESVLSGVADRLFQTALSFPSTPSLETATLDRICTAVERILPATARRVA